MTTIDLRSCIDSIFALVFIRSGYNLRRIIFLSITIIGQNIQLDNYNDVWHTTYLVLSI